MATKYKVEIGEHFIRFDLRSGIYHVDLIDAANTSLPAILHTKPVASFENEEDAKAFVENKNRCVK